jgi:sugar lactone lactonase YvrE
LEGYKAEEANLALGNSQGVAISAIGEIYVSDSGHHQVLKVNPTTGLISIVAGNGTQAYNGDGLPAPSAGLNSPGDLAFDSTGNLFICDNGNFIIRRVDALSGIITTVAGTGLKTAPNATPPAPLGDGGLAIAATFDKLGSLLIDAAGLITVCDTGNNCVRQFTVGGNINTIAGVANTGGSFAGDGVAGGALAARFNQPTGLAQDASGSFYISDSGNRRVRKLSAATVTTVVGDGMGGNNGFTGDGGPAAAAQVGSLGGLAFDLNGSLLIACTGSGRIRKVDVNGASPIILTVAGNGGGSQFGDLGPATGAALTAPRDVAVDAAGNFYIYESRLIRRVDQATGFIDTVVGTGLTGFIGDRGAQQFGVLVSPSGAAFDAAGNLYIADAADNAVRKISTDGKITTFAGDGVNSGLGDGGPAFLASVGVPIDVTIFGNTLFIAENARDRIRSVDLTTGIIQTYAQINGPVAIVADPTGILYVAHGDVISQIGLDKNVTDFAGQNPMNTVANPNGDGLPAANARLRAPSGLALTVAGELLIADTGGNLIRKIGAPPGLIVSTIAGGGAPVPPSIGDGGDALAASLNLPGGVAIDATRILISDTGNERIRAIDLASNVITTIAGTGTLGFNGDGDVAVNAQVNTPGHMLINAGALVFADVGNNRIREIVRAIDIPTGGVTFSAKLSFSTDKKTGLIVNGKDSVSIKAGLLLPAGINAANLVLRVDVIDLHQQTQLDASGKLPKAVKAAKAAATGAFDFTLPTPPATPTSKFSLGLKGTSVAGGKPTSFSFSTNGTLREELGRAGYTDVTTLKDGVALPVRVNITLGTTTFTGLVNTNYKATQGKSGAAKTVK